MIDHFITNFPMHHNFWVRLVYLCATVGLTYCLCVFVFGALSSALLKSRRKHTTYEVVDPYTIVDMTHRRLTPDLYAPFENTNKIEDRMCPGEAVVILTTEPPGGVIVSDKRGNIVNGQPHPEEHHDGPRDRTTDAFEVFVNGEGVRGFKRYQFRRSANVRNTWIITL